MMKKITIMLLVCVLLLSFGACTKKAEVSELVGYWQLMDEDVIAYGMLLSFTEETVAYGFSAELAEGETALDYLDVFKVMAALFEVEYSIDGDVIVLHTAELNSYYDEEAGEMIEYEDTRISYTLSGDVLMLRGNRYERIIEDPNAIPTEKPFYAEKSIGGGA